MFDEVLKLSYTNQREWDLLLVDDQYKQREASMGILEAKEANLQNCLEVVEGFWKHNYSRA